MQQNGHIDREGYFMFVIPCVCVCMCVCMYACVCDHLKYVHTFPGFNVISSSFVAALETLS